jgi:hypothetical protein
MAKSTLPESTAKAHVATKAERLELGRYAYEEIRGVANAARAALINPQVGGYGGYDQYELLLALRGMLLRITLLSDIVCSSLIDSDEITRDDLQSMIDSLGLQNSDMALRLSHG